MCEGPGRSLEEHIHNSKHTPIHHISPAGVVITVRLTTLYTQPYHSQMFLHKRNTAVIASPWNSYWCKCFFLFERLDMKVSRKNNYQCDLFFIPWLFLVLVTTDVTASAQNDYWCDILFRKINWLLTWLFRLKIATDVTVSQQNDYKYMTVSQQNDYKYMTVSLQDDYKYMTVSLQNDYWYDSFSTKWLLIWLFLYKMTTDMAVSLQNYYWYMTVSLQNDY